MADWPRVACRGAFDGGSHISLGRGEADKLGLVAFDDQVEQFRPQMASATIENRDELRRFLSGIHAHGATELNQAVQAAVKLAGRERAEFVMMTDGR